ncbi:hypothetical protein FDP41_002413 [Naegleria fowleri]|uniref:SHSP domain-containing protein n=1 Tax=Naegleria fowleri TaxID=5763 RepID=A0A6A5BKR2_NAEFO|nr:uncharacterized protein FDP41_002413 [Naegleria fowleri]KAF0978593.1 hypothetical protein FDP41_002413 [Naegleria fowleri]CAG4715774.1 unnamed protein product [Naegleria fowleri]
MTNHHNRQLAKAHPRSNWLNTFFDDPFFTAFDRNDDRLVSVFRPTTDVSETDREVKIVCNVPGMTKENIKIDVDEEHRSLTVSGEMKKETREENETYHCVERSHGTFSRTVYLPSNADLDGIKANLEHGVLRVSVPKIVEEQKKKTRSVNIE